MELAYKIFLSVHIGAGFLALVCGLIAMITKKGLKIHKLTGKIFSAAMLLVAFSALALSIIKPSAFLFSIGLFALYQNYSGYRAIKNKTLVANNLDWIMVILALLNSIFMFYTLNTILMVFGAINAIITERQLRVFLKLKAGKVIAKNVWLKQHIGMMVGTYIATLTAFIVVNFKASWFNNSVPAWLPWLLPTLILLPLIFYWNNKIY